MSHPAPRRPLTTAERRITAAPSMQAIYAADQRLNQLRVDRDKEWARIRGRRKEIKRKQQAKAALDREIALIKARKAAIDKAIGRDEAWIRQRKADITVYRKHLRTRREQLARQVKDKIVASACKEVGLPVPLATHPKSGDLRWEVRQHIRAHLIDPLKPFTKTDIYRALTDERGFNFFSSSILRTLHTMAKKGWLEILEGGGKGGHPIVFRPIPERFPPD